VTTLRVGFAGTPGFAATALAALADAGFTIPLVLTRPDRPKGRGLALAPSPVKVLALARAIPVQQPPTLKSPEARAAALAVPLDVLVVAAYGLILPQAVLAWPRAGCINIHASLLPRWRGAAPIARAVEAGDPVSGVTIMQMDAGLDTGPMLARRELVLDPRETAGTLHDRVAIAGAEAIVATLRTLECEGRLAGTPQPAAGATYANKIGRDDARLDWTREAATLDRQVRAMDPVPGAWTTFGGDDVKVWRATPLPASPAAPPGTVLAVGTPGIDVACGHGALRIEVLQPAGGRRMDATAFVAGRAVAPGAHFGAERA
jgi:methionyl-tRNA formyltransferase